MENYRIVRKGGKYIPQTRVLYFFWVNIPRISTLNCIGYIEFEFQKYDYKYHLRECALKVIEDFDEFRRNTKKMYGKKYTLYKGKYICLDKSVFIKKNNYSDISYSCTMYDNDFSKFEMKMRDQFAEDKIEYIKL